MEGDLDTRMENFKQSILTAHALDIAKLQDSTLAEMKRIKVRTHGFSVCRLQRRDDYSHHIFVLYFQAEAEVRYQEGAGRARHLHEQVLDLI